MSHFIQVVLALLAFLASTESIASPVPNSSWELLASTEHDSSCFTEGLQFIDENTLIESCGLYNVSKIHIIDFSEFNVNHQTPPRIIKSAEIANEFFAEGITYHDNELYLLTWKENKMLVFDSQSLELKRTLSYPLSGWGLVYRESTQTFLATDGSHNIYHLSTDGDEVKISRAVPIICDEQPIDELTEIKNLNEIELIGNDLLANVWHTDLVYRVNPDTGACLSIYNLAGLDKGPNADVLNGIALPIKSSKTSAAVWFTGKNWDKMHLIDIEM